MAAQLYDDVDQPQREYFDAIAKAMRDDANVILCGPEPGWLYTSRRGKSFEVIDYVGWRALQKSLRVNIPILLSGDTHHYSRYVAEDGVTQFITSGGGGAFLHPTHSLAKTIDLGGNAWLGGRAKTLTLAADPNPVDRVQVKEALYPTRAESVKMLAGNFKFAALNPGFAVLLGVLYWLVGLLAVHLGWDALYVVPLVFFAGFWVYTGKQEGGGWKVFAVSAVNGIVHGGVVILLARFFYHLNDGWSQWPVFSFVPFAVEMIAAGFLIAPLLFGIYLYVTSRCMDLNHNDAFSSMRLDSHRHFLRMHIKDDEVTIYPIGLDRVPSRSEWRCNEQKIGMPPAAYVPDPPLLPHLIEGPIVVRVPTRPI